MLVLTRKPDQSIMVGNEIEITVLEVRGEQIRIGIRAPRHITVHRKEVFEQISQENQKALSAPVAADSLAGLDALLPRVIAAR